jgi:Phage terminase, small subunit
LLMGGETGFVRLKKNPACTVSETAMKTMKSFLVEFGMTPAARSRIRIEKPKEADPFEDYLKKGASSASISTKVDTYPAQTHASAARTPSQTQSGEQYDDCVCRFRHIAPPPL